MTNTSEIVVNNGQMNKFWIVCYRDRSFLSKDPKLARGIIDPGENIGSRYACGSVDMMRFTPNIPDSSLLPSIKPYLQAWHWVGSTSPCGSKASVGTIE